MLMERGESTQFVECTYECFFPVRCTCNRPLGQLWKQYQNLKEQGYDNQQIANMLGIIDACCRKSLDIDCDKEYYTSMFKKPELTDGISPFIQISEESWAAKPEREFTSSIDTTGSSVTIINKSTIQTLPDTISRLTEAMRDM